jgi:dihydrofolate reductase
MGDIQVHEFITVDGVIESPSWTADYPFDPKMGEAIGRIVATSQALLMGRNTYEMFYPAWSTRTAEDDPGAPFFNEYPKYVVTSTLQSTEWQNSSVLGPYQPDTIQALKDRIDGNIYVSGSAKLVRSMLADGLVDELNLFVYPLVLGGGEKLFVDDGATIKLALGGTEPYDSGVVRLTYRRS